MFSLFGSQEMDDTAEGFIRPYRSSIRRRVFGIKVVHGIHTFLFRRAYFCDIGSYQIISDEEKPRMTSIWVAERVSWLTS